MPALYHTIFDEIDEMSVAAAACLARAGLRAARLADERLSRLLLNAIEVSTPELESMVGIARNAGAIGAKLTGAGGGGSIVALCPGKVMPS